MNALQHTLEKLGLKIRELRKKQGLSQEEFAYRANIDRSYVGQIERGERNIAFLNLLKIARALEVTLSELMDGIE